MFYYGAYKGCHCQNFVPQFEWQTKLAISYLEVLLMPAQRNRWAIDSLLGSLARVASTSVLIVDLRSRVCSWRPVKITRRGNRKAYPLTDTPDKPGAEDQGENSKPDSEEQPKRKQGGTKGHKGNRQELRKTQDVRDLYPLRG